jgi:hypothetical protein
LISRTSWARKTPGEWWRVVGKVYVEGVIMGEAIVHSESRKLISSDEGHPGRFTDVFHV